MIDPVGLFFVILIFAPFLLIIVPTLLCHTIVGVAKRWRQRRAEI